MQKSKPATTDALKRLTNEGTDTRWRTKGGWFNDKKRGACPDVCLLCKGTGSVTTVRIYDGPDGEVLGDAPKTNVCSVCGGTGETI